MILRLLRRSNYLNGRFPILKKLRQIYLFTRYRFYKKFDINRPIPITIQDRQLGISTLLVKEAMENYQPIIVKTEREKTRIRTIARDMGIGVYALDHYILSVDDIRSGRIIGAYPHDAIFLSDCLTKYEIEGIKKRFPEIKIRGFVRLFM